MMQKDHITRYPSITTLKTITLCAKNLLIVNICKNAIGGRDSYYKQLMSSPCWKHGYKCDISALIRTSASSWTWSLWLRNLAISECLHHKSYSWERVLPTLYVLTNNRSTLSPSFRFEHIFVTRKTIQTNVISPSNYQCPKEIIYNLVTRQRVVSCIYQGGCERSLWLIPIICNFRSLSPRTSCNFFSVQGPHSWIGLLLIMYTHAVSWIHWDCTWHMIS